MAAAFESDAPIPSWPSSGIRPGWRRGPCGSSSLLAAARRAILGELGQAAGFRLFHLSQVLAAVDRAIRASRSRAEALIAGRTRDTWRLGDRLVDVALKAEDAGPTASRRRCSMLLWT